MPQNPSGYALTQGFPQIAAPFIVNNGRINQPWLQVIIALWNGVLAAQGQNTFAPGDIKLISYPSIPNAWLACDGAAVSRTTYAALFTVIGTMYGIGDGSTTFNVPNLISITPSGMTYIIHVGG